MIVTRSITVYQTIKYALILQNNFFKSSDHDFLFEWQSRHSCHYDLSLTTDSCHYRLHVDYKKEQNQMHLINIGRIIINKTHTDQSKDSPFTMFYCRAANQSIASLRSSRLINFHFTARNKGGLCSCDTRKVKLSLVFSFFHHLLATI